MCDSTLHLNLHFFNYKKDYIFYAVIYHWCFLLLTTPVPGIWVFPFSRVSQIKLNVSSYLLLFFFQLIH